MGWWMGWCHPTKKLYIFTVHCGKNARAAVVRWRLTKMYGNRHEEKPHVRQAGKPWDKCVSVNCAGFRDTVSHSLRYWVAEAKFTAIEKTLAARVRDPYGANSVTHRHNHGKHGVLHFTSLTLPHSSALYRVTITECRRYQTIGTSNKELGVYGSIILWRIDTLLGNGPKNTHSWQ